MTNVSISKLVIGTKAKHFDLVCLLSERKQNILIWYIKHCIASRSFSFRPKNSGTKQSNLIWSGNCLRQSRTFLFNPKTNRSKQNILIWSSYYQNESKTFWFGPLIIGTKAKQFNLLRIISAKTTPHRWVGESATLRINESGSRYSKKALIFLHCRACWKVGKFAGWDE
jgi:hypothetical protein